MASELSYYELNKKDLERIQKETDPIYDNYSFEIANRLLIDGYAEVRFHLDKETGLLTHKFECNKDKNAP